MKPKLRFKEFSDEWCETTLGETTTFKQGIQVDVDKQFSKPFDNSVRFIRIVDYTQNTKDIRYISKPANANYVDEHDVVLVRYGATAGFVGHGIKGVIANNMFTVTPNSNINKDFLYTILKQDKIYNKLNSSNGSSAMPALNFGSVSILKFSYPSIDEQNKLTNLINLLDKKIELQSKKIEDLKLFKKGLIHQMKKSNNNWSEYKISEIFKITRGVVIPKTDLLDNKTTEYQYPVYSSQTSNNGILGYDTKFDFDGKYLTWTTDGANAGKVFYRNGKFRCTNVCGVLYNDNNKYVDELTAELLNYETPKHVSYVGNPKLMNNVMGDIKIFLPDSNESDRVSNILLIINNKVLLETDKLNKLNKLKKGLMQKMFV